MHNKLKRLPKGNVSYYLADGGYYGFVVLDAVYEGRLLAVTGKLSQIPQNKEDVLNSRALTAIWILLRSVQKGKKNLGTVEIKGDFNGRGGLFICKAVSLGINNSIYLDECHRRAILDLSEYKISDLLKPENIPIKFFNEETAKSETRLVLELMKNPASEAARKMIRKAVYLEGFFG